MNAPHTTDYTDYTDVIIDLETLGDTPDSIPIQMAVVFFDLHDHDKPLTGGTTDIHPQSGRDIGLISTASTLEWWKEKGLDLPGVNGDNVHLQHALNAFAAAFEYRANENARIWSRGNSFDLAILKLAYHRHGDNPPWQFWKEADVRTHLFALTGSTKGRPNTHVALEDCVNELLDLQETTLGRAWIDHSLEIARHRF